MASILIVDDSSIMRKNLKTILHEAGHIVVAEASNGSDAYTEYIKHKPDLVTLDITMPYMNGLDTLKKIINTDSSAKIIIISSTNNNRTILESIQNGAKNYIIKPFMVDKVLEVVNQVLQLDNSIDDSAINKIYRNIQKVKSESSLNKPINTSLSELKSNISADNALYTIILKDNSFIINIKDEIDSFSFYTLCNTIQSFLVVKPLNIIFTLNDYRQTNRDYLLKLIVFCDDVLKAGGTVTIISENRELVQTIMDMDINPYVNFYSNLSDIT